MSTPTGPVEMHGDHPFVPGVDVDMVAEGRQPSPLWCNTCGEARDVDPDAAARARGEIG